MVLAKDYIKSASEKFNISLYDAKYIVAEFLNLAFTDVDQTSVNNKEIIKLNKYCKKVSSGYPPQYLFKKAYLYGNEFKINKHTLIPRFDSEVMLEEILSNIKDGNLVCEVGTGSGALIMSVASKFPKANYTACDISSKALKVAKCNNKRLKLNISFIKSDLFAKVKGQFNIVIANLPYLTLNEIKGSLVYEPKLALDGQGSDGLDIIKEFLKQLPNHLLPQGLAYIECNSHQIPLIKEYLLISKLPFEVINIGQDYHHLDRYLIIRSK